MGERAPGGEMRRTPLEWMELLCFFATPRFGTVERAAKLDPIPVTRFEFYEAMAFIAKREDPWASA